MAKKITNGKVYEFVKENLVTANDRRMACADGRYKPEQSKGAIRVFGADMGILMAIGATLKDMGVSLPASEIVEKYAKAKQGLYDLDVVDSDFVLDYHCDTHSHEAGDIGCGHIAKAANPANEGLYGSINAQEVRELFDAFTENPKSHLTVLEGQHEEEGVIFVRGSSDKVDYSVNSSGGKKGKMFFVVDPARTEGYIDSISGLFSEGLVNPINPEDVKRNYSIQMQSTAKLLNADKLPWYNAAINNNGHFILEQVSKTN